MFGHKSVFPNWMHWAMSCYLCAMCYIRMLSVKTGCNGPYLDATWSADVITCGLSVVKGSCLCPNVYVRLFFNDLIIQVGKTRDNLITWFESCIGCGGDHVWWLVILSNVIVVQVPVIDCRDSVTCGSREMSITLRCEFWCYARRCGVDHVARL